MKRLNKNPYFNAFKHPEIYFFRMLKSTISIGISTLVITWLYLNTPLNSLKIPIGIHSMFGFVIAMLLVFRTNTAYDRWWEGRKLIQEWKSNILNMHIFLVHRESWNSFKDHYKKRNDIFQKYIQGKTSREIFYTEWKNKTYSIYSEQKKCNLEAATQFEQSEKQFMSLVTACERVKDTPIPLAYRIHIKLCVFIYIVTLPFSMFHDASLWSTPLVMFLYFIISGVEIISTEIENPFSGEPNDLPLNDLFMDIEECLQKID